MKQDLKFQAVELDKLKIKVKIRSKEIRSEYVMLKFDQPFILYYLGWNWIRGYLRDEIGSEGIYVTKYGRMFVPSPIQRLSPAQWWSWLGTNRRDITCRICLDNACNAILLPCGHTSCHQCGEILKREKKDCHICRAKIRQLQRMFLSYVDEYFNLNCAETCVNKCNFW